MKNIFLILVVLLITGCGGEVAHVDIPANTDIRADVAFRTDESGTRHVNVVFYFSTPVAPGQKDSPPQKTVPVADPRINDQPLTQATSESGTTYYTGTGIDSLPSNLVSARVNGKLYEGRTVPGAAIQNKQATVTLSPK